MHGFALTRLLGTGLLLMAILMLMGLVVLAVALHPYGRPTTRTH